MSSVICEVFRMPIPNGGDWLVYDGSGQPVPNGTYVQTFERHCLGTGGSLAEHTFWSWSSEQPGSDIIRYRVVSEAPRSSWWKRVLRWQVGHP